MIATFIIKADVTKMALTEHCIEDNIIDTLTTEFTNHTGNTYKDGTVWLDNVITEQ
jgi:hypothetical protein